MKLLFKKKKWINESEVLLYFYKHINVYRLLEK